MNENWQQERTIKNNHVHMVRCIHTHTHSKCSLVLYYKLEQFVHKLNSTQPSSQHEYFFATLLEPISLNQTTLTYLLLKFVYVNIGLPILRLSNLLLCTHVVLINTKQNEQPGGKSIHMYSCMEQVCAVVSNVSFMIWFV